MITLVLLYALAQGAPTLHQRPADPDAAAGMETVNATGHTDLPPEAEGRYALNTHGNAHDGVITIFFEGGTLRGYLSEQEEGTAVTLPFTATHAEGSAITFTTRRVHGRVYSFRGRLEHGPGLNPGEPGFYLLTGTLTREGGSPPLPVHSERQPGPL